MPSRHPRPSLLALLIIAVGALDYWTGPDIALSLLYLVPVIIAGWRLGTPTAMGMGLLASGTWASSEFAWRSITAVSLWNAFTRIAIYLGIAWLMARVKLDREQLLELNSKLSAVLAEEEKRARSDALTGLPNHRLFMDELRRAAARSDRAARPMIVGYLDLDNFKRLNDLHGHAAGNDVLRRVADHLQSNLRTGDIAARLGGDEFGLLIPDADFDVANQIGGRIVSACEWLAKDYPDLRLGISAGLVCFERPPADPDVLLQIADEAMYRAKRDGRNRVAVERGPDRPPAPFTRATVH